MTDLVFLHLLAGNGGHGRVSFRREKYVPKGGPDGGDGGNGGHIIIRGNKNLSTLKDYAGKTSFAAKNGGFGGKKKSFGPKADPVELDVPVGTSIWQITENTIAHRRRLVNNLTELFKKDQVGMERYQLEKEGQFIPERPHDELLEPEKLEDIKHSKKFDPEAFKLQKLIEITEDGQEVVLCQGGFGGRGNVHFKSSSLTTPLVAEYGSFGEQRLVAFELRLLADVGLVGFPNAGKSTLLSRLTKARPKVASYPFTTLEPHLGIFLNPVDGKELVLADIPGLIEGASAGKGLGFQFLRHVENSTALVTVVSVDESTLGKGSVEEQAATAWQQYTALQTELKEYKPLLAEKKQVVVLNKIDLYSPELIKEVKVLFKKQHLDITPISAATGEGLEQLFQQLTLLS